MDERDWQFKGDKHRFDCFFEALLDRKEEILGAYSVPSLKKKSGSFPVLPSDSEKFSGIGFVEYPFLLGGAHGISPNKAFPSAWMISQTPP